MLIVRKRKHFYSIATSMVLFCSLLLAGCDSKIERINTGSVAEENISKSKNSSKEQTVEFFAMDTYMTITAYGTDAKKATKKAKAEVKRLEKLLSTGSKSGEIARINAGENLKVSEDTEHLLKRAIELGKETEGAFNIAIYPFMQAWGFTTQKYRVPKAEELKSLLKQTDYKKVSYNQEKREVAFLQEGMQIDLGGIAKGYTSDRIMEIFEEYKVDSGVVSLGGNVQVYHDKIDGTQWKIAVRGTEDEEKYLGILEASDCAVITSGDYERYFTKNGKKYHHIIDPDTGYPVENGIHSVTIISKDGGLADGLSTALFVMGKEKAISYWREHTSEFDFVIYEEEGVVSVSEGIQDKFTSDYEIQVITEND